MINSKKVRKIVLYIIGAIFILYSLLFIITEGKGAYKLSGCLGCSNSIIESKKRDVFIGRLIYSITPDTINISNDNIFFIERGFRYGKWSANTTDSLSKKDFFKYQVVLEGENSCPVNFYRINDYWIKGEYRFSEIPDTITLNIYELRGGINEIGKLKLTKNSAEQSQN